MTERLQRSPMSPRDRYLPYDVLQLAWTTEKCAGIQGREGPEVRDWMRQLSCSAHKKSILKFSHSVAVRHLNIATYERTRRQLIRKGNVRERPVLHYYSVDYPYSVLTACIRASCHCAWPSSHRFKISNLAQRPWVTFKSIESDVSQLY